MRVLSLDICEGTDFLKFLLGDVAFLATESPKDEAGLIFVSFFDQPTR